MGICVLCDLTHIKLKSLVLKGVCAASSLIMLLQNNNLLPSFGQKSGRCQTSDTTADHHRIQSRGNTVHTKTCGGEHIAHFAFALQNECGGRLPNWSLEPILDIFFQACRTHTTHLYIVLMRLHERYKNIEAQLQS